jgi:Ca2+-binding EF-hand superfamily protein
MSKGQTSQRLSNNVKIINYTKEFVTELSNISDDKNQKSPLFLYKRLLDTLDKCDRPDRKKRTLQITKGFTKFFIANDKYITTNSLNKMPETVKIPCTENVYIDIGTIYHKQDEQNKTIIYKHLLIITAHVLPTEEKFLLLGKQKEANVKMSDQENNLMDKIMGKLQANFSPEAETNPMQALGKMVMDGSMKEIFEDFKGAAENGQIDMGNMFNVMQSKFNTSMNEVKSQI